MKDIMILMIKFYRKYLSPLKTTKCPYIPTCSEYGLEAIEKHGAFKGGLLTTMHKKYVNDEDLTFVQKLPQLLFTLIGAHIIEVILCYFSMTDAYI